jgi:hypothetical protein
MKADYFLFNDDDCPRRVEISDIWVKMAFRSLRSGVLAGGEVRDHILAITEYLIRLMGAPGLSRAGILTQLEREHKVVNFRDKVAAFSRRTSFHGQSGQTFVEVVARNLSEVIPEVENQAGSSGK